MAIGSVFVLSLQFCGGSWTTDTELAFHETIHNKNLRKEMLDILTRWHRGSTYSRMTRETHTEEDELMMKEEDLSPRLSDGDDELSVPSSSHSRNENSSSGYSPTSTAAFFALGILLGSFIPIWFGHGTVPLSFVPELNLKGYVFGDTPEFSSKAADHGNASWASLIPARNGMIQIDEPEKYGLRPGLPLYSNKNPVNAVRKKYALSAFHQLHCLQMLRENYMIHIGVFQGVSEHHSTTTDHEEAHLEHCFDYLRQSIMCCADTTVEWSNPHAGKTQKPLIDGWGIPHAQCKDWNQLLAFLKEHEAPLVVD